MKNVKLVKAVIISTGVFLLIGMGVFFSRDKKVDTTTNTIKNNEISTNTTETQKISIENLTFYDTNIEMDIKETKDIFVNVIPSNADISKIKFYSTDSQIADFSKNFSLSNFSTIYGKIKPLAEGECEIYVESNEVKSNMVKVTIIDNERIENERKAQEEAERKAQEEAQKKAQEEAERKAQEEAARKAQEEAQRKAQEEATRKAQTQTQPNKATTAESQPTTNNGKTVYVTPTGKRYHFSSTCGGKNSSASTLSQALARGLTPCKKCAQ